MERERSLKSLSTITVFISCFCLIVWALYASGIVYSQFEPQVKEGKLGGSVASSMTAGIEWLIGAVATVLLFLFRIGGNLSKMLFEILAGFLLESRTENETENHKAFLMQQDMSNLLVEMAIQGKGDIVVSLVNELAGKKLVRPTNPWTENEVE